MVSFSGLASGVRRLGSRLASSASNFAQSAALSSTKFFKPKTLSAATSLLDSADDFALSGAKVFRPKMGIDDATFPTFDPRKHGGGEFVQPNLRRPPKGMTDYGTDFDGLVNMRPVTNKIQPSMPPGAVSASRQRYFDLVPEFDDDIVTSGSNLLKKKNPTLSVDKPLPDLPGRYKPLPKTPYNNVVGELNMRGTSTTRIKPRNVDVNKSLPTLSGQPGVDGFDEFGFMDSAPKPPPRTNKPLPGLPGSNKPLPDLPLDWETNPLYNQNLGDLGPRGDMYGVYNTNAIKRPAPDGFGGSTDDLGGNAGTSTKKPRSWRPGKLASGVGSLAAMGMQVYNVVKSATDTDNRDKNDDDDNNGTVIVNNSPVFYGPSPADSKPPEEKKDPPPVQPRGIDSRVVRVPTADVNGDGVADDVEEVQQQNVF